MARSSDIPSIDFRVASGEIETHPFLNGRKIHGDATVTVILRSLMVASRFHTRCCLRHGDGFADFLAEQREGITIPVSITRKNPYLFKILSTPETCMATYLDGSLKVFEPSIPEGKAVSWDSKDKKKGVMYWTLNDKAAMVYRDGTLYGTVEGRPQEVRKIFREVFPFARSISTTLSEFDFGMTEDQCVSLINEIEKKHPRGSSGKGHWIKTFVEDNMAAAMELAKKHGTYEDLAA